MKIRCVDNSIRLRLTKSDLEHLRDTGKVEITLAFPCSQSFVFSLKTVVDQKTASAQLESSRMTVVLPLSDARTWAGTDQVGLSYQISTSESENLELLIEKDFPCKTREDEDKANTFWELADQGC